MGNEKHCSIITLMNNKESILYMDEYIHPFTYICTSVGVQIKEIPSVLNGANMRN